MRVWLVDFIKNHINSTIRRHNRIGNYECIVTRRILSSVFVSIRETEGRQEDNRPSPRVFYLYFMTCYKFQFVYPLLYA